MKNSRLGYNPANITCFPRCLQDVLKTSSKRLQDIFAIRLRKTSSRRLQDVLQLCLQDVLEEKNVILKTSSVRLHQGECLLGMYSHKKLNKDETNKRRVHISLSPFNLFSKKI